MTQTYPQYPLAPQYPQYPQQPPPGIQQNYPPQYAQPGYPPVAAPPPPVPVATGSLDSFFNQPSTGGGKGLTFTTPGESYTGIVTRPINNGDIAQQTDTQNRPQFFKDGRPKFVMKVPLQMQPSAAYPDGLCQWYVKGQARDELVRAMAEAGAPEGPPEHGSIITITHTGLRQSGPGMNPAKLFQVQYRRPQNVTTTPAPSPAPPPVTDPLPPAPPAPAAPVPAPAPAPLPPYQQPPPPAPTNPTFVPQTYQQWDADNSAAMNPQQAQYAAPAPVPAPAPAGAQPPADLTDEQKALLAQLTGGQG